MGYFNIFLFLFGIWFIVSLDMDLFLFMAVQIIILFILPYLPVLYSPMCILICIYIQNVIYIQYIYLLFMLHIFMYLFYITLLIFTYVNIMEIVHFTGVSCGFCFYFFKSFKNITYFWDFYKTELRIQYFLTDFHFTPDINM